MTFVTVVTSFKCPGTSEAFASTSLTLVLGYDLQQFSVATQRTQSCFLRTVVLGVRKGAGQMWWEASAMSASTQVQSQMLICTGTVGLTVCQLLFTVTRNLYKNN